MELVSKRKPKKILYFLIILAIALIAIGITKLVIFEIGRFNATVPFETSSETTVTQSSDTPSEATVPSSYSLQVPADQPREIKIPAIQVSGYIQKVGIDQDNKIAVPNNIYLAGWYTGSVKPGEVGLSIIDGHVLGRYNDAIFKDLVNLKAGDTFSVIYGDDSTRIFLVKEVKTLPLNETASYLMQLDQSIKKQLNLITCGGTFDSGSGEYDQRVVVKSEAI